MLWINSIGRALLVNADPFLLKAARSECDEVDNKVSLIVTIRLLANLVWRGYRSQLARVKDLFWDGREESPGVRHSVFLRNTTEHGDLWRRNRTGWCGASTSKRGFVILKYNIERTKHTVSLSFIASVVMNRRWGVADNIVTLEVVWATSGIERQHYTMGEFSERERLCKISLWKAEAV